MRRIGFAGCKVGGIEPVETERFEGGRNTGGKEERSAIDRLLLRLQ